MRKLKIVFVGPNAVGKTRLVNRYTQNLLSKRYINTIGCDIYVKNVNMQGEACRLVIHDIGGQLVLREYPRRCLENLDIVMVVFALNERETYDVSEYITDVLATPGKPTWAIVGNKEDLLDTGGLDVSLVNTLARTHEVPLYFTSTRDDKNVQVVILGLVKKCTESRTSRKVNNGKTRNELRSMCNRITFPPS